MGALVGIRSQSYQDRLFDASGTIAAGSVAQLVLPMAFTRSSLIIENISSANMFIEIGAARATATLGTGTTAGTVASCSIVNAGFGYTYAPSVMFLGGALGARGSPEAYPTYTLAGLPDWASPANAATGYAVLSGNTVGSIVITNPGSGYAYPPYVFLFNGPKDPFGCATPSATSGIELISSGGSYTSNGSVCTTDQVAIFCATTGAAYTVKFTV